MCHALCQVLHMYNFSEPSVHPFVEVENGGLLRLRNQVQTGSLTSEANVLNHYALLHLTEMPLNVWVKQLCFFTSNKVKSDYKLILLFDSQQPMHTQSIQHFLS